MWMLAALVDLQLGQHFAAELVFWQHPPHSIPHDLFWLSFHAATGSLRFQTSVTGVPGVRFLVQLTASKFDFLAIRKNDKIAGINIGRINGPMFAHQDHRNVGGDSTNDLIFAVDDPPILWDRMMLSVI